MVLPEAAGRKEGSPRLHPAPGRRAGRAGASSAPVADAAGCVGLWFFGDPCGKCRRIEESTGGFFLEGKKGKPTRGAILVLTGKVGTSGVLVAAPGDVLLGDAASLSTLKARDRKPAYLLFEEFSFEEISGTPPGPLRCIRRDDLAGKGVSGITGIRTLARIQDLSIVRLGPPPGARWALVGLRSFAVFAGRITAIDGGEPHDVNAGELALIADPSGHAVPPGRQRFRTRNRLRGARPHRRPGVRQSGPFRRTYDRSTRFGSRPCSRPRDLSDAEPEGRDDVGELTLALHRKGQPRHEQGNSQADRPGRAPRQRAPRQQPDRGHGPIPREPPDPVDRQRGRRQGRPPPHERARREPRPGARLGDRLESRGETDEEAHRRRRSRRLLPVPRADAPFREGSEGADREAPERCPGTAPGAWKESAPPRPPHGGHRLSGEGDPGSGGRRPAHREADLGRAAREDPRSEDEGGRQGPLAEAARRAPPEAPSHHGRAGEEIRVRRRRHREARPGHRAEGAREAEEVAHARHPLRGQRLLRRHVRELLPRERAGRAQRAGVRVGPPGGQGHEVHPAHRDRDVLHPRAEEADDRSGERARLSAELLQQLLRADEGDGLHRDRPLPHREGPARGAAPALHRHRPLQDGQQPRRHEGRQRAHQRVREVQGSARQARRAT